MRAFVIALVLAASGVSAHPLGNFTTNRLARVEVAPGALRVGYLADLAELPAYRALAALDTNADGRPDDAELAAWARDLAAAVAAGLHVSVDGGDLALRATAARAAVVPGTAGLPTLRAEVALEAPLAAARAHVVVRDDTFAGLPGWQEIVAGGADGTALAASTAAARDPTDGLRRYPADLLAAPPARREARFEYAPGGAASDATTEPAPVPSNAARFGDRLTALVADRRPLSAGIVLSALALAVLLGAFHALTPGHGKTIVGAYLVGARGTWKHAVLLGLVVTATHTAGIYALGLATLGASAWIVPERLLPWLSAASGLLVVAVGVSLLRQRLEVALHGHGHGDHHHHHGDRDHGHHHHLPPAAPTLRNLVALGVSGGLLPCPSALVVMLGAIALGRTAFGLVLIVAFSLGLAAVLTAIGVTLVFARGLFDRLPLGGWVARLLPVASAAVISLAGLALVIEALVRGA